MASFDVDRDGVIELDDLRLSIENLIDENDDGKATAKDWVLKLFDGDDDKEITEEDAPAILEKIYDTSKFPQKLQKQLAKLGRQIDDDQLKKLVADPRMQMFIRRTLLKRA